MVLLPRSGPLGQFRSARLGVTTYDLKLWKVITPLSELHFGCSFDSMESPLSQNDVTIFNFTIRTSLDKVIVLLLRSGQLGQFRSARLGVTTCDLQLWKVITSSSELHFGCS